MHTLDGIVAHAHLLPPVRTRDLINQLVKKLLSLLAVSLTACVKPRSEDQNLLPT